MQAYIQKFGKEPYVIGMFWNNRERFNQNLLDAIKSGVPYNEYELLDDDDKKAFDEGLLLFWAMKILSTYCSAEKQTDVGNVPATSRYISKRIDWVAKQSEKENRPLFIFSGKYGIIPATYLIPYYDHLLTKEEVSAHAKKVASQIKEHGITRITFYTRSLQQDPNLAPYINCVTQAAELAKVDLVVKEEAFGG